MTKRSATHDTFVVMRDYPHPPAKVFAAYADPKNKAKWFGGPADWERLEHQFDFRIGGKEIESGGPRGGTVHTMIGEYWDIVENERIVMCYEMQLDKVRISISLGTTELRASATGTTLTYTEQGVYLDGFDDAGGREEGTRELLDQLGRFLDS